MENDRYVLDANVILEYIYDRSFKEHSKKIIENAILRKIQLFVPSLLLDEITEVLCGNLDNLKEIKQHLEYIEKLANRGVMQIIVPNTEVRMKAIEIARTGNSKSGYPELTDSLYHALAILNDAVFITNDTKYISKVKHFNHIEELSKFENFTEK